MTEHEARGEAHGAFAVAQVNRVDHTSRLSSCPMAQGARVKGVDVRPACKRTHFHRVSELVDEGVAILVSASREPAVYRTPADKAEG
eukprot:CAMPEP_0185163116 /NCGR_PEP_ID=MMETSP1139-20130426/7558_1 /TAXON_ID=298111 /ORGANISM="Pavlova sp., Strain CCMP459" /LENGTH=86 /DNA_ID=CAMNT_0027728463 /DNA_START=218 /DNA_END=478 /DNA_ORIENTATION=-